MLTNGGLNIDFEPFGAGDTPAPFGWRANTGSRLARYGFAAASSLAALSLTLVLQHVQAGRPSLFLFFAAIVTSAWFGGTGAGIAALALSAPAGLYFYAASLGTLANSTDAVILLLLFVLCAFAGGLLSSWRRSTDRALSHRANQLQRANDSLRAEIRERRRAEQALQGAQAELARAARLTMMGELAATIAHEINQPLAAISNSAGACMRWLNAEPPDLGEARRTASWIMRDTERAAQVVSRVRTMVHSAFPERVTLDLEPVIRDVLGFMEHDLRRRNVLIETQFEARAKLQADHVQLQQVFQNLFQNAIDAMDQVPPGHRRIAVRSRDTDDGLVVEIEDSGGGFDGEAERLFQPFFTTKRDGMGLGLPICRSIIESHGGELAASRRARGACFHIHLPGAS